MTAYLIAHLTGLSDPAGLEEYRAKVRSVIETYGGQFLAAGAPDVKEGELRPLTAAVIAFPTIEKLNAFYDAPEYQELKALRQRSSTGHLLFLDGLPSQ